MKAIFNILKRSNAITQERVIVDRRLLKFDNSKSALWSRAERYAH